MTEPQDEPADASITRVQTIYCGDRRLGLPVAVIDDIAEAGEIIPLPHAPRSILGVLSLRGRMLTVIDLAALLDGDGARPGKSIIALRGDEQIALAVERVGAVLEMADAPLVQDSELAAPLSGTVSDGHDKITMIDVRTLFATAMRGRERRQRGL